MNSLQEFGLVVSGQVTAISFVAVLLIWLSRNNAARRHTVGFVGLVLVLGSPLLAALLPPSGWWPADSNAAVPRASLEATEPRQNQSDAENRRTDVPASEPAAVAVPELVESPLSDRTVKTTATGPNRSYVRGLLNLAGAVWLAGAAVLMSRWLWQHWRLRGLVHSLSLDRETDSLARGDVADEVCRALHLPRLPPIIVSEAVPLAMVLGIWRPCIVLPRELVQSGEARRLRDVLIHEGAHIVRGDPWVNAGQRLASILWWWHPGVVWLNRLIAQSREEVCDNFVLRHGDAPSYAQTLLELSELCTSRRDLATGLELLGSKWTLEERISGLLKPGRNTMTKTKLQTVVMIAALLGGMCLLVGGVQGVDEPRPESNEKKQSDAASPKSVSEEQPKEVAQPATKEEPSKKTPSPKTQVVPSTNGVADQQADVKSIAGRIVDKQDRPVAGAQLWWVVSRGVPEGVTIKGVSDEQGRFSMSTPGVAPQRPSWRDNTLWVLCKGKQLATIPTTNWGELNGNKHDLVVRLEEETDTSFVVIGSDRKPVADVIVEPRHLLTHRGYDIIPAEARKIIGAKTDAEGRVRMPQMLRKGFHTVLAISDSFGTQVFQLDAVFKQPAERTLELRTTGRIEGQLTAEKPEWVRGVEIWFTTAGDPSKPNWKTEGEASAKTDAQGHFTVPAIASGRLRIYIRPLGRDIPVLPRFPKVRAMADGFDPSIVGLPELLNVKVGKTEKVRITLETPVTVRGTILTDDTQKPIPGAEIAVQYGDGQADHVVSDAEGQYEARVLPGPVWASVIVRPKEFSTYEEVGLSWDRKVEVPNQATPFDLPTTRLIATVPLKGKLIDQKGRPVAKVRINGIKGNRRYGFGTTNELGEFSMPIPKTITLEGYEVWLDEETIRATPTIEKDEPLTLRVTVPDN
ncbi:MAG: M56 family metallopeptidase [Pirellulaceae bacterium]